MDKSLMPYDLGISTVTDNCARVSIKEITSYYSKAWKQNLLDSPVTIGGSDIRLTASVTRWGGIRLWFSCPLCKKRRGTLFAQPATNKMGCRACLGLKYRTQRYKGMVESNVAV
jgi:hypothetical protein